MAGALGVVIANNVSVAGQHAQPVYVDDSLPIVGPSRAVVVGAADIPQMGGPPIAVRLAPAGTPAIGPALPIYIIPGGGSLDSTFAYTNKVIGLTPIAYWPLAEPSGTTIVDESGNGRNGAYTAVTVAQPGIGDGRTSASFDGATSFGNIFSASLQGAFNGAEGTLALWAKVSAAGVWTDATARDLTNLGVSGSNVPRIQKPTTSNQMQCTYIAGGTNKTVNIGTSTTAWVHFAMTWSKSADQMIAYINGVQSGATQTGLGVFAGSLSATLTTIGAASTVPAAVWSGLLAHVAVWATPLSAGQIATLAVVP